MDGVVPAPGPVEADDTNSADATTSDLQDQEGGSAKQDSQHEPPPPIVLVKSQSKSSSEGSDLNGQPQT